MIEKKMSVKLRSRNKVHLWHLLFVICFFKVDGSWAQSLALEDKSLSIMEAGEGFDTFSRRTLDNKCIQIYLKAIFLNTK
jgi:hypothetical protein